MNSALAGRSVLVTGGTGFIGGRLVERLVMECRANVRVLARRFDRAARLARFPVEIVAGSVTEPSDVNRAMHGCDVVFHCAYGNSDSADTRRLVNVEGTRNVLDAAVRSDVKRVVHVSTVMVYGMQDGDLDETAPRRHLGDVYADTKLDAENLVFAYGKKHHLPVVVLQPTVVYGPFGSIWTTNVLNRLRTTRQILVNGGDGLCNAVYIDDVVSALLLAVTQDGAVGEAFLVSGEEPVTWREFFGAYERMLGESSTVVLSAKEAAALYARTREKPRPLVKETLRILHEYPNVRRQIAGTRELVAIRHLATLLPKSIRRSLKRTVASDGAGIPPAGSPQEKVIYPWPPLMLQLYAAKTRVRIDKAKRVMGYRPAFDLTRGMGLTQAWAEWAGLLASSRR